MHFRGKSFKATFQSNNGDGTLLHVPSYDFNWQHNYEFESPIDLNDLESITAEVVFDNSEDNPFNPDPTQFVTWGDQTWEEMAVGFFDVALPRENSKDKQATKTKANSKPENQSKSEIAGNKKDQELETQVNEFVDDFFKRFDANNNGLITREELPLSIRSWGMSRLQSDNKSGLTREEIAIQARQRFKRRNNK